jgi:hypothetical protein
MMLMSTLEMRIQNQIQNIEKGTHCVEIAYNFFFFHSFGITFVTRCGFPNCNSSAIMGLHICRLGCWGCCTFQSGEGCKPSEAYYNGPLTFFLLSFYSHLRSLSSQIGCLNFFPLGDGKISKWGGV